MNSTASIGTWPTPERIGVLLVHGIGEQTRFQHLESEARNLARALKDLGHPDAQVCVQANSSAPFASPQEVWESDVGAPVWIDVPGDSPKRIEFREVWWADLDEPPNWWVSAGFWLWGFSMWARGHRRGAKPDAPIHLPGNAWDFWVVERVKLFAVGWVFMLLLGSAAFLQWVARRIGWNLALTELLVAYVGDVKLYQQPGVEGKGPMVDLHAAPRRAIRRRMVQGLTDMALLDYDRWYVFAHSLGTVVAFNGLMEPDAVLGHYLDQRRWAKVHGPGSRNWTVSNPGAAEAPGGLDETPPAPVWIPTNTVLPRKILFAKLAGLLTYGSPLDKFATIWPRIVLYNDRANDFPADFRWLNVADAADPVAGALDAFKWPPGSGESRPPTPENRIYNSGRPHLLSHIRYLSSACWYCRPWWRKGLAEVAGEWLLAGERYRFPDPGGWQWPRRRGLFHSIQAVFKYLCWALITLVTAMLWTLWLPWVWSWLQPFLPSLLGLTESATLALQEARATLATLLTETSTVPAFGDNLLAALQAAALAAWVPLVVAAVLVLLVGIAVRLTMD